MDTAKKKGASDIDAYSQEDTPVEQEESPQEQDTSLVPVRRPGRDCRPQSLMSIGLYDIADIGTTSVGHTFTMEHSKPTAECQKRLSTFRL